MPGQKVRCPCYRFYNSNHINCKRLGILRSNYYNVNMLIFKNHIYYSYPKLIGFSTDALTLTRTINEFLILVVQHCIS